MSCKKWLSSSESIDASVPATGCTKDIECKGDRLCEGGRCVAPVALRAPRDEDGGAPPNMQRELVIFDPRLPNSDARVTDHVEKAEAGAVLSALFPRFLRNGDQCSGKSTSLADARERGDIIPRVNMKATGSFTGVGKQETLYVVAVGECGASHADSWGSTLIASFAGQQVTAKAGLHGGSLVERVVDVDADGRDELVLTSSFTQMGRLTRSVAVGRMMGSDLGEVRDFGWVDDNNCASTDADKRHEFTVIKALVQAGRPPEFKTEKVRVSIAQGCP